MHPVQPPQEGHVVEHHMLRIDGKIEQHEACNARNKPGHPDKAHEAPTFELRRNADRQHRQQQRQQPHDHRIHEAEPDIAAPSPPACHRRSERPRNLGQRNENEDACKGSKPNQSLAAVTHLSW